MKRLRTLSMYTSSINVSNQFRCPDLTPSAFCFLVEGVMEHDYSKAPPSSLPPGYGAKKMTTFLCFTYTHSAPPASVEYGGGNGGPSSNPYAYR